MGQGMGMFHHIGSTFRFLNSMAQKRNVDSNWSGSFKIIWMLVRRRGSGKCLQEQLVWRVRLMQFLCLNSLDRKDQGFRKMNKNICMEFEETHGFIKCSWFTSLEPLYQFFASVPNHVTMFSLPIQLFRGSGLCFNHFELPSNLNELWQPTLTTKASKLLRPVCLSMTRWMKSTLTPALLGLESPRRMTSRIRRRGKVKVDGSIQRRSSTRSNGKSRGAALKQWIQVGW